MHVYILLVYIYVENILSVLFIFYFIYLFFPFLATLWPMEFPGWGSDSSCSCNLSLSCSNARSLTHCARQGMEPLFQFSQDPANPIAPQEDLKFCLFYLFINVLFLCFLFLLSFAFVTNISHVDNI